MTTLLALLAAWFAADVAALDSPRYREREAASARLRRALPWSLPAVLGGCSAASPEVQARCRRLADPYPTREELAAVLLVCRSADWCSEAEGRAWSSPARLAVLDRTFRRYGLLAVDELTCLGWDAGSPAGQVQGAVNVLRRRIAGRPFPYPIDPRGPRPAPMPSEECYP